MFNKNKKKLEFNNDELRILRYSLTDFRNDLLKENRYTDAVDETLIKLKNKMKADKYDLGIMINGLDKKRKTMISEIQDTSNVDELLLKLLDIHKKL